MNIELKIAKLGNSKSISVEDIEPPPDQSRKYGSKVIGRGAANKVYVGTWQNTAVAAKVRPLGFKDGNDFIRFRMEVRIMTMLAHPNIVAIYGAVFDPYCPTVVMSYCTGLLSFF